MPIAPRVAVAVLLAAALARPARADEVGGCCGKTVTVAGDVHHARRPADVTVRGPAADADVYDEEVFGRSLSVTVDGLTPGRYRVVIDLAESHVQLPDIRRIDIAVAGRPVATDLDPTIAAGGFGRGCQVTADAAVTADAPLLITLVGRRQNAMFNALTVFDARGRRVAAASAAELVDPADATAARLPDVPGPVLYTDADQPLDRRVDDLVRRLSLREKAAQLQNAAPAVKRLNLPAYDYWNEALHGYARAGLATVFPQAIGMAATFDPALLRAAGDAVATEGRAKFHDAVRRGTYGQYYGLTVWSPNVNIVRDPRWGRGQETYGEDPLLTGRLAVAYIGGLQGDDPRYYKLIACAKHFAVHSGPEPLRHTFDARPPLCDLHDTYLPQFEMAVRDGRVGCVMAAYNRLYGVPAPASTLLLTETLRDQWHFGGYVVSDCGAVGDIHLGHKAAATPQAAAAMALKAGCDLECGSTYAALVRAVRDGLATEADVDRALHRVLAGRFKLGLFDPPERVPYAAIPITAVDSPAHRALALRAARESVVLLRNQNRTLPLDRTKVRRLAVIGPNADATTMLRGNYNGSAADPVNVLAGIRAAAGPGVTVMYETGCSLASGAHPPANPDDAVEALNLARDADAIVFVGGLDPYLEGEEMNTRLDGFAGGDRTKIELPAVQAALLRRLLDTGKPVVFVCCSGSAIALPRSVDAVPAVVQAWYPGQAGGTAVADVLFGTVNPSGRLPVTAYRSTADLPPFDDYSMANRTYRYFTGTPLFPFGHGLSYTTFQYGPPKLNASVTADGTAHLTVTVTNAGDRDGDEVVQAYARPPAGPAVDGERAPVRQLVAFQRVSIPKGTSADVTLDIPATTLRRWDAARAAETVRPGDYAIEVAASSADVRQTATLHVRAAAATRP